LDKDDEKRREAPRADERSTHCIWDMKDASFREKTRRHSTLDARRSTLDARRSTLDARRSTLDARRSPSPSPPLSVLRRLIVPA
jgi:hypothetical protein